MHTRKVEVFYGESSAVHTEHPRHCEAVIPPWVPQVLQTILGGIFKKLSLSKFGLVKLKYFDLIDRNKLHSAHASVDFFNLSKNEFIVNVVFTKLYIRPIFPFRRVSILVSIRSDSAIVRKVLGLLSEDCFASYNTGIPLTINDDVFIRELETKDAETLYETVRASGHLHRFLSNFVKETGSSIERCRWALDVWERRSRLDQSIHFGLFKASSLLGVVHVEKKLVGSHRVGVVEYWLASSATGNGLAPLMVTSALHWARVSLLIDAAHFDVHPDNEPSIKVLCKLGASLIKAKKKKMKMFETYRLVLDEHWSLLKAALRPWTSSDQFTVHLSNFAVEVGRTRATDDVRLGARKQTSVKRHSVGHTTYFGKEEAPSETPGSQAHRMRIPVTGPGIALRQVVGASAKSGYWFIVFIKEFDRNSICKDSILALKAFWPDEGFYFGREDVVSVVDLNQCDSSDQRESLVKRFKLTVDQLPQARLLVGGRVIPYEGTLSDPHAISSFLNTTRAIELTDH